MNDYDKLLSSNEQYDKHYNRWKYLLHSYMGGETYKKGEYLSRYQMETEVEYQERLSVTPLDNHAKGVIEIYQSFLFRSPIYRDFGSLENDTVLQPLLEDCDLDGRSFDAFMKDVSGYSSIFGHCYVVVAKPQTNARTRAEELQQEVRPYVNVLTPINVLDWRWRRATSGHYYLEYFKYVEDFANGEMTIKEWYEDAVITTIVDDDKKEIREQMIDENGLGFIPTVCCYNKRSPIRGIGVGDLDDISDLQRSIFQEYSEVEQLIRLTNHPSLVKPSTVEAIGGAGAIIQMPEDLDPGLKPYLLQPGGQSLDGLYKSIEAKVDAIDRIAHLGAMRENRASTMSGVSREMEFQQLNALLSEKADNLELAEENIWRIIAQYQGKVWDGTIDYPDSFNIQDKHSDMGLLEMANRANPQDPALRQLIDYKIKMILDDEEEFIYDDKERVKDRIKEIEEMEHPVTIPGESRTEHIQEMIMAGYTDQQILDLHPEINSNDIQIAKQDLLEQ